MASMAGFETRGLDAGYGATECHSEARTLGSLAQETVSYTLYNSGALDGLSAGEYIRFKTRITHAVYEARVQRG